MVQADNEEEVFVGIWAHIRILGTEFSGFSYAGDLQQQIAVAAEGLVAVHIEAEEELDDYFLEFWVHTRIAPDLELHL